MTITLDVEASDTMSYPPRSAMSGVTADHDCNEAVNQITMKKDLTYVLFTIVNKKKIRTQTGQEKLISSPEVYEEIFLMISKDWKGAATLFLNVMPTFTATELVDFKDFVFYTAILTMVALDRPTLWEKLISSPKDFVFYTASVPESKTIDVYNSFSNLVSPDVPPYVMSTVKEVFLKFLKFKDVVKANPITPAAATSSVSGGRIDEAAAKLSADSYKFIKDVDGTSNLLLKKPGYATASVPESMTMDVYNSLSYLVSSDVPPYLMATVKEADSKSLRGIPKIQRCGEGKPITPAAATSSVSGGRIDEAAAKLSADSYVFIKDVDWTSNLFLKKPGYVTAKDAFTAVDMALVMGAAMDPQAFQEAAQALWKPSPTWTPRVYSRSSMERN